LLEEAIKFFQLLFEVFKLGIVFVEMLKCFEGTLSPQPREFLETGKELVDFVLGALDRTGKKQNNLNNFLVFGNPIVEGFTFIFGLVLLVPILDLLCAL